MSGHIARTQGLKAAYNFLWVKLFNPVGPGSAGFVYFFFGWLYRRFPQLVRMPGQIEVELTTVCDKKCIHCENTMWDVRDQPALNITFDELKTMMDSIPKLKWASLVGEGSSFLNKDCMKMLRYLKERKVMVYQVDHLSDLTEEMIEELVDMKIDGMVVSFDAATKETYEAIKVGCKFDNVNTNIQRFLDMKKKKNSMLPEIVFGYTVMNNNVNEIPQFIDHIADFAPRTDFGPGGRINFNRMLVFDDIKHLEQKEIPKEIIQKGSERAAARKWFASFTGTNDLSDCPGPEMCMAWMEPYVMMKGLVMQCCAVFISNNRPQLRKRAFGNLIETPMKEIWNSKPYVQTRKLINRSNQPIPLNCAGCRIFNTRPREEKYGVLDTHSGRLMSQEEFVREYQGESMQMHYDLDIVDKRDANKSIPVEEGQKMNTE
ncbi:MAG: SPASM domain-containing protein [Magnetococcales bacterium]|nr:SPASM domain-containing protein [Magnetococcales bacterium]